MPGSATSSPNPPDRSPWTSQTPTQPPRSTMRSTKRKRSTSSSPSPSSRRRARNERLNTNSETASAETTENVVQPSNGNSGPSTSAAGAAVTVPPIGMERDTLGSSTDEELWDRELWDDATSAVLRQLDASEPQQLEEESDDPNGVGVARRLDFIGMRPENASGPSNQRAAGDGFPVIGDDESNPFLVTPSTMGTFQATQPNDSPTQSNSTATPASSRNHSMTSNLSGLESPSQSMDLISQVENGISELRRRVSTLERKSLADKRSIGARDKRINDQKQEIEKLRAENARLRRMGGD